MVEAGLFEMAFEQSREGGGLWESGGLWLRDQLFRCPRAVFEGQQRDCCGWSQVMGVRGG